MIFQYQQRAEPLPLPPPAVETWWPVFPDRVPHRRGVVHDVISLLSPISAPVAVEWWTPSFPDRVPRLRGTPLDVISFLAPVSAPAVSVDFWAPSFPDRVPHRLSRLDPARVFGVDFLGDLPGRWSPRGFLFPIAEQASGIYHATLVGRDGVTPLPGSLLQSLTLTLYTIRQDDTGAIVNGRNRQNVLNQNFVSVSTGGRLTWIVQPGDTTLVDPLLPFERHIGLFEWTWARGAGKKEVILVVRNLRRVN